MDDRDRFMLLPAGADIEAAASERSIIVQTRRGTSIPNETFAEEPARMRTPEARRRSHGFVMELIAGRHGQIGCRDVRLRREASARYNCHGMTFANRRTNIVHDADVHQVLTDDRYAEIRPDEVKPGDIVVYYDERGGITHTGVVMFIRRGPAGGTIPFVLSKWARHGEYLHPVGVFVPYTTFRYFREGSE
ncbi:MAG: hypothetical protein HY321_06380 [Armatimonadetes bacterium]|nr:hypothetical protein [Armatimonadota bacterium]